MIYMMVTMSPVSTLLKETTGPGSLKIPLPPLPPQEEHLANLFHQDPTESLDFSGLTNSLLSQLQQLNHCSTTASTQSTLLHQTIWLTWTFTSQTSLLAIQALASDNKSHLS